jgi:asparagine synthase (glutamine-hydrolysing)
MCGIIGFQGHFGANALSAGLAAIRHRGPDDGGEFHDVDAGVGLGHARLSIIDLSPLGHQPMFDAASGVQLVFNGEIYNYRELRAELESAGCTFKGKSDTEVLLQMYLAHGDGMLPRLNGIFAFAIWDPRDRRMLVVRDGLGVKPLYFAESGSGFTFCSEIKGLLRIDTASRRLDCAALDRYLTFLWCPGAGTPMEGIRKVLPGEAIEVVGGKVRRRWTWYQLPQFRGVRPDLSEADSIRGTELGVRQAVHRQMVADVPVGAFLSGGLDSSSVVAFAREVNPHIRCFTIEAQGGHDQGETDDLPYARRVAKHLGVPLEAVRIDASCLAADLERMVTQLDEPLADPAPLNVLYICQLAREHGVKVMLSGAGGDDLFTGYRRHVALRAERLWSWLPGPALALVDGSTQRLDQRRAAFRRIAKLFRGASFRGDRRLVSYFEWARRSDLHSLYSDDFLERLGTSRAEEPMLEFLRPLPPSVDPLDRMLALEQRFFLSDHNLPYTDKMSMAVGVEVRVPFLDLDLVDFAARIPATVKQRGKIGKWVFKRAMEPYLPSDVIHRPKSGFTAPLRRWIRADLRPLVGDLLGPDAVRRRGLFRPEAVQALVEANLQGRVDASHTVLSLLCIEIWCRSFLDQGSSASGTA